MGERIKGSGTKKMLLVLGCFLLYYIVAGEVAAAIALLANLDATMALMVGRALTALIFFLALGGRRYLRLDWHAINRGISSNRIFKEGASLDFRVCPAGRLACPRCACPGSSRL